MKTVLQGPLSRLGYGITTMNVLKAMVAAGHDTTLVPIGPIQADALDHQTARLVATLTFPTNRQTYDPDAPIIRNYHEFQVSFPPSRGKKIVWPFFEVDQLAQESIHLLNLCDAVAAGSEWIVDTLRKNGIKVPIFLAHQGVDTSVFKPLNIPPDETRDSVYKFFTLGKFESRKGHYELLQAFKEAFPKEEDVRLYMMVHNPFLPPGSTSGQISHLTKGDPRVRMVNPVKTSAEVAQYINLWDCGIFASKGEGWGCPILESLACGKPIITTFVTSHATYLDDNVALEVKTDGLVPAHDGVFFHGRGQWYQPSVDSLKEQMRRAYDEKLKTNPAGIERAKQYPWSRSVEMLVEGIDGL